MVFSVPLGLHYRQIKFVLPAPLYGAFSTNVLLRINHSHSHCVHGNNRQDPQRLNIKDHEKDSD